MKLKSLIMLLICFAAAGLYSSDNSKKISYSYTVSDWRTVNPEKKDFVFEGVGYQSNIGALYKNNSGAKHFYVDPVNGSPKGDGSSKHPWKTLQQVLEQGLVETWNRPAIDVQRNKNPKKSEAPVKGGDVIILREGNHGDILIRESYNNKFITICAAPGERPVVKSIRFISSGNWRVDGLYITRENSSNDFDKGKLLMVQSFKTRSVNIEFYNNIIYSFWDSRKWSKEDWNKYACNGINLDGDYCVLNNNYFRNVDFGISILGEHNNVINNTVKNFSGDGMRGIGNYLLFEKNFVKNVFRVNSNHADGFQSFCKGAIKELHNNTLRKNVILNYEDISQPFRGPLQGIGCFDGFYREWIVENNLIVTDHWHGITFMGVTDSVVRKNIVIDINNVKPGPVKISIRAHKDKRKSRNCRISQNVAQNISLDQTNENVKESDNMIINENEKSKIFVDPANHDFRLKSPYSAYLH